jgi:hypothetical protein
MIILCTERSRGNEMQMSLEFNRNCANPIKKVLPEDGVKYSNTSTANDPNLSDRVADTYGDNSSI